MMSSKRTTTNKKHSHVKVRQVADLKEDDHIKYWDDNDGRAPLPAQPLLWKNMLWFPILAVVAHVSVRAIKEGGSITATMFWILYEAYILYDHFPFLCTNDLYTSARINFENLSVSFFWGLEATASVIAHQSVGAPLVVLGNIPNHLFFICANYFGGAAASKAFLWEKKRDSTWILFGVAWDTAIHATSLWYYLLHLNGGNSIQATGWWFTLLVAMLRLTIWVHGEFMSLDHFLVHFGYRPAAFASSSDVAK